MIPAVKRLAIVLLLVSVAARPEESPKTVKARYIGMIMSSSGYGYLAALNPWVRFYACFDFNGELLLGGKSAILWNQWKSTFPWVEAGRTLKARYDNQHIWVAWSTGKEIRFNRDYSNTRIVAWCRERMEHTPNKISN